MKKVMWIASNVHAILFHRQRKESSLKHKFKPRNLENRCVTRPVRKTRDKELKHMQDNNVFEVVRLSRSQVSHEGAVHVGCKI